MMTIAAADQRKAQAIFSLVNPGCVSYSNVGERQLKKLNGIKKASADYVTDAVNVDFDPSLVTADAILALFTKLGQRTKGR